MCISLKEQLRSAFETKMMQNGCMYKYKKEGNTMEREDVLSMSQEYIIKSPGKTWKKIRKKFLAVKCIKRNRDPIAWVIAN